MQTQQEAPTRQNFLGSLADLPNNKASKQSLTSLKPKVVCPQQIPQTPAGSKKPQASEKSLALNSKGKETPKNQTSARPTPPSTYKSHPQISKLKIPTATQLKYDDEHYTSLKNELDEKITEVVRLEGQLRAAVELKLSSDKEITDLKKKLAQERAEKSSLEDQLQKKDSAINDLLFEKKIVDQELASKSRLLKERQDLTSKTFINTAIENQKRVYEAEIENRNLKIEMLEQHLKAAEDRVKLLQTTPQMTDTVVSGHFKAQTNFFPIQDGTMEELHQKIRALEMKLKEKDDYAARSTERDRDDRDAVVSSLLIKGFVKENERLMQENHDLKSLFSEQNKGKTKLLVSNDDNKEHIETIKRLQDELLKKDELFRKKEATMREKVERADHLESKQQLKEEELKSLRADVEAMRDRVKALESDLRRREVDCKTLHVQNEQLLEELQEAKFELNR